MVVSKSLFWHLVSNAATTRMGMTINQIKQNYVTPYASILPKLIANVDSKLRF